MAKILIVLPYSGRGFGGGLAVFNADITKAFTDVGHDVRLLTMAFGNNDIVPKQEDHGKAKLLFIKNSTALSMKNPGGASGEDDRNKLYELFNSDEVLLNTDVNKMIEEGNWVPDIIIGHSRFSGPAAVKLRDNCFRKEAKALYFMHSYPVEGSVLSGYEAFEENLSSDVAMKKFADEKTWMPKADLVVAVGPLIRSGVQLILEEAKSSVHVHECIGGVTTAAKPATFVADPVGYTRFLFLGRASAPIKGLDALILAAVALRQEPISITIRYWDDRTYTDPERAVTKSDVQSFIDGALNTKDPACKIRVTIADKVTNTAAEVLSYHGLLMPSYIEHFGLVPFDALGCGVPVLVNEISGAGMFLGDSNRFGVSGPPCVVQDFNAKHPLKPADYLQNVAPTAFDKRPEAWAGAIGQYVKEVPKRFKDATQIYNILKQYTWADCALGIVKAVTVNHDFSKPLVTLQLPGGEIAPLSQ